ncbi:hypothetical protein ACJIZ3_013824 [Penstemon smallii]|uniref:F-box associated beta-propeller type 1 domain-containing protein n=1 Tax=Penstemon smallii TaxID=265156 RepID=A0ABD3RL80_9LAMI
MKIVLLQFVDPQEIRKPHLMVNLYNLTTNSWKQIDYGDIIQVGYDRASHYFQLFFNGACHWDLKHGGSDSMYTFLCFDVSTEVLRWLEYPPDIPMKYGWRSLFVVNGCLAVVWYANWEEVPSPIVIWVMKEYGVKESWFKHSVIEPFEDYFYPFLPWKNEWLLLDKAEGDKIDQLVSCSFHSNELKKHQIYGQGTTFRALFYKESLISLDQLIN